MNNDEIIEVLSAMPFSTLSEIELQRLMIVMAYVSEEFAESIRIALLLYPDNEGFAEVSRGEIQTDNLQFGDFNGSADHSEFLFHFIKKYKLDEKFPETVLAGKEFQERIRTLPGDIRAMSVASRETIGYDFFSQILRAKDWTLPGLPEFQYFLAAHVAIDGAEGGHGDLLEEFPVTSEVMTFYDAFIDTCRTIPGLSK